MLICYYIDFFKAKGLIMGLKTSEKRTPSFTRITGDAELFFTAKYEEHFNLVKYDNNYIANNIHVIAAEADNLYKVLSRLRNDKENNELKDNEQFLQALEKYLQILETHALDYHNARHAKQYRDKLEKIERLRNPNMPRKKEAEQTTLEQLKATAYKFFQSSEIRSSVGILNLYRIFLVFWRFTILQALVVAEANHLLNQFDKVFGTHTDLQKITKAFYMPTPVMNALSVGFFLTYFVLELGALLKHVFFPSEIEKELPMKQRLKNELAKRKFNLMDNGIWAFVNLLTNYNYLFKIPAPVAGYLIAGFLFYDVLMVLVRYKEAKNDYEIQKAQYTSKLKSLRDETAKAMCRRQLDELEISWNTKKSTYMFAATAAALLLTGFTASMLITLPMVNIAFFFLCTVAISMYLTRSTYADYKEKKLRLSLFKEKDKVYGHLVKEADADYRKARNEFIFQMAEHTIVPTILLTTYALYFPVAIALTVLYLGYKIAAHYSCKNTKPEEREQAEALTPAMA